MLGLFSDEFKKRASLLIDSVNHWLKMVVYVEEHLEEIKKTIKEGDSFFEEFDDYLITAIGESFRSDSCPLCSEYLDKECADCPVVVNSEGKKGCFNTPWEGIRKARNVDEWLRYAMKEASFLSNIISEEIRKRTEN